MEIGPKPQILRQILFLKKSKINGRKPEMFKGAMNRQNY